MIVEDALEHVGNLLLVTARQLHVFLKLRQGIPNLHIQLLLFRGQHTVSVSFLSLTLDYLLRRFLLFLPCPHVLLHIQVALLSGQCPPCISQTSRNDQHTG